MANPTLIAFSEKDSGASAAASEPSATLTWQTGDVLVAVAMNEGANNGVTFSISNTGSGLSWTAAQSHSALNDTSIYAWTTVATANSSGVITATESLSNEMAMGVYQFRAPSGATIAVGNSHLSTGQTASPQVTALTMTSVDSSVVWAAADWSAGTTETPSPAATSHSAASPGPTASPITGTQATHYTWYIDELDDEASTGSVNFGYSGSSAGPFAIVAVEVTISGGVAGPAFSPRRMPLGV